MADFTYQTWVHQKTGGKYRIMDFPIREYDLKPMVSYQSLEKDGPRFLRTCEEFFDGRFVNNDRAADRKTGDDVGES
jgi:hypothetical protein